MDTPVKVTIKESIQRFFKKEPQRERPQRLVETTTMDSELRSIFSLCSAPISVFNVPLRVRQEGFWRLQRVMQVVKDSQLNDLEMRLILWPAIGMYCYFRMTPKRNWSLRDRLTIWWRSYEVRTARFYLHVVQRLLKCVSYRQQAVVGCILNFLSEYKLWKRKALATLIIMRPVAAGVAPSMVLNLLLDRLLMQLESIEGRNVVRVLYEIFNFCDWPLLNDRGAQAITRLLKIYRTALRLEFSEQYWNLTHCTALRKGLEVTLLRIIEHLFNSDVILIISYMVEWFFDPKNTEPIILTFGIVLEHAALVHNTELYKNTFLEQLLENIMKLIGSRRRFICHLGNRILQHLLDRHDNRREFHTPRIFFQNSHFNVTVATFQAEDGEFLKKHRKLFHNKFLIALIQHSNDRDMLETIYATICLLAVEIPCAYSAAVMANFAINVQDTALFMNDIEERVKYHMHIVTMGLMSLICWLYNAADFYKYINKVINRRAEHAPHLNPPLRTCYTFVRHSVLRNDPTLYFDVWEVRYSLWMRFKIKHAQAFLEAMDATSPPTASELKQALENGLEPSLAARVQYPTRRNMLRPFLPTRDGGLTIHDVLSVDSVEIDEDPRLLDFFVQETMWSPREKREQPEKVRDHDIKPLPKLQEVEQEDPLIVLVG